MQSDDDRLDALRRVYREASAQVDDAPAASVRATVLAAAARAVDARPRSATMDGATTATARGPFPARRWPLSAAALLVVSLMTGLVATQVMRDGPERITAVASSTPATPSVARVVPAPAATDAAKPSAAAPIVAPAERTPIAAPPRTTARKAAPEQRAIAPAVAEAPAPTAQSSLATPSTASPAAAAPAQRAKTRDAAESNEGQVLGDVGEALARRQPREDVARAPTAASARARIASVPEPPTPEAWVARIVKLRADGNDIEADRELDALRRRYPGFAIPAGALRSGEPR